MIRAAPAVSVVIPAFNRAATLRGSMQSVLRQSYRDLELLVVDDGSSDNSVEVARSVDDARVRVVENQTNLGAAGARNAGVANSRGRWIAFQDSDDEWLPDKLERQMARLHERGPDQVAAYCGLLTLGGLDDVAGERLVVRYVPGRCDAPVDGVLLEGLLRTNLISTQTLVVRRDVFESVGGFDPGTTPIEDWDFALALCQQGPISLVDEPLVFQRFSANSISRDTTRRLAAQIRVLDKHQAVFARYPHLLAYHYYMISGGFRSCGDLRRARGYLAKALRADPSNLKTWGRSAHVALLSLFPGAVRMRA